MKKVLTTSITTSAAAKIKSGTIDHIQNASKEMLNYIALAIGGQNLDNSVVTPYIITGCINSGSGSNYVFTEGLIYYDNELYYVPAATFTTTGPEVVVATITTAYISSASFDPVLFTDGSSHNIHQNKTIVLSDGNSGTGTFDFTDSVYVSPGAVNTYGGSYGANWAGVGSVIKYIKNRDGLVSVYGTLQCHSGPPALSQVILTLPVGFRPRQITYINSLKYRSTPLLDGCVIRIGTNGEVVLDRVQTALAVNDYMFFDNINFYTPLIY